MREHEYMKTVALIDDDPSLRTAMETSGPLFGVAITAFSDEEECRGYFDDKYDVGAVIADLRMPGTDGVAVLERIRSSAPNVDLILLTGYNTTEGQDARLRRIRAKAYSKRSDLEELLEALGNVSAESSSQLSEHESSLARSVLEVQKRAELAMSYNRRIAQSLAEDIALLSPLEQESYTFAGETAMRPIDLLAEINELTPRGQKLFELWIEVERDIKNRRQSHGWLRRFFRGSM